VVQLAEAARIANQSLTTLSNAPSGFYASMVNGMASDYVTKQSSMPQLPNLPSAPSSSGGSTVTGNNISISIDGSGDPNATAKAVVAAIRTLGRASGGGINDSVAASMELI